MKAEMTATDTEVSNVLAGHSCYRQQTFQQRYLGGTKRTLRAFILVAFVVLIVNVSWLAYAIARYGISDGYGTISHGICSEVESVNTWLHLGINILSTLLLTASNAFMAAYCCPSRKEIDKAHEQGNSLQLGSLSLGNLKWIAKRKGFVVIILALSSVPLHLLFNSLVFTTQTVNEYYWTIGNEDFVTGAPFNLTGNFAGTDGYPVFQATFPNLDLYVTLARGPAHYGQLIKAMDDYFGGIQTSAPAWERLENRDCIQAYSNLFVSSRRNVVLVSSTKSDNVTIPKLTSGGPNSILDYGSTDIHSNLAGNFWICSEVEYDTPNIRCNPNDYLPQASSWNVFGFPIEYCLSEKTDDICSVQFSLTIMLVVISFNALKVLMMAWVLIRFDAERILVSIGDAAASFLRTEDFTTAGMCLASRREVHKFLKAPSLARPFNRVSGLWGAAISPLPLAVFFSLMIVSIAAVSSLLAWGLFHIKVEGIAINLVSIWNLGFGIINQNTMVIVGGIGNAVTMALLANLPQVFLAIIYVLYMGVMTSMFLAQDWSRFAFEPQTLMVSRPAGRQRGTWLLGAPILWGLALLSLQILLHWFVSRSIFVVQLSVYDKDGKPVLGDYHDLNYGRTTYSTFSNCGYSPMAIICSLATAGVLLLTAIIFVLRRFPDGAPPIASTSTAAISAACHPSDSKEGLEYRELRWGVDSGFDDEVGHCSLVSAETWNSDATNKPRDGALYAGLLDKRC